MTRRGWTAAGWLLLTVAGCSQPNASPFPAVTPSVASLSPISPSPTPSASPATPSTSPSPSPTPTVPTTTPPPTPRPTPTPSATTTEPPAVQQFTLDEAAEFDDGLIIEIAGSVADKAKKTDKGAAATKGQIVIASVRIENGTMRTYDAAPVQITATYGKGAAAELIIDKTDALQRGFAGNVKPNHESIATLGFAIPHMHLKRVTFVIDPNDDEHDPVSFTGKVRRL